MADYKSDFKGMCEWRFQDRELEDSYASFVKDQEQSDPDYEAWMRDYEERKEVEQVN